MDPVSQLLQSIMNNSKEHLTFIKNEKRTRVAMWMYLGLFTILQGFLWDWHDLNFRYTVSPFLYYTLLTNAILFVILLFYVLYKLINTMAKFHVEEYEIHRCRMFSFVFIESLIIAYQFNHGLKHGEFDGVVVMFIWYA